MQAEGSGRFNTTHWSVIVAAGGDDTDAARVALATLCETYWYPLYAYVRRRGSDPHEAQDLVQGFFAALLEKGYVKDADQERGRFRGFLATAFRRFVTKQRAHDAAQKRGGGRPLLSFDFDDGETRYRHEPVDTLTADKIYDRRWTLTVLDSVLRRLRAEFGRTAKSQMFDEMKVYLAGGSPLPSYRTVAQRLRMTEGAVKVAVHRLRRRYRDLLRDEIARTVSDPASVDDEIRHLIEALAT